MKHFAYTVLIAAALPALCAAQTTDTATRDAQLGVVVMAHGGSDEWNEGVLSAVDPLREEYDVEVAFGMADAASIQQSVESLEARGATNIAVVRMFISGDSWRERTQQILGLMPGAPARPPHEHDTDMEGHHSAFWKITSGAAFAVSANGLADAEGMGIVLADRAEALSRDPSREEVLILAHGPEDDEENERWISAIDAHAEYVRRRLPFHGVHVETLREDWPEKRTLAEQRIHEIARNTAESDRTLIVIPFRVHGFGPYADALEGIDYVADGQGLIPHPQITAWLDQQVSILSADFFTAPY